MAVFDVWRFEPLKSGLCSLARMGWGMFSEAIVSEEMVYLSLSS